MKRFSPQTIEALTQVVTGGGAYDGKESVGHYRSGPELQRFFGEANLELSIGRASRVPTVRELLTKTNAQGGQEAIVRVLEQVADPAEYLDVPEKLTAVVEHLNKRLSYDGYELRLIGDHYKLTAIATNTQVTTTFRDTVSALDLESVQDDFGRAVAQAETDPPDAITAACSTLESVCKCLLDKMKRPYPGKQDITGLVKEVSKYLRLSPGRKDLPTEVEQDIRAILGGLVTVTSSVGALRTHAGDAHGRGKSRVKADARIARLAIHAASTIALFYIETWQRLTPVKRQ